MKSVILCCLSIPASFVFCQQSNPEFSNGNISSTNLGNGKTFPLVGMGVGNLQRDLIISQIVSGVGGIQPDVVHKIESDNNEVEREQYMNYRLIDTAHASENEGLVHDGIIQGLAKSDPKEVVHVITKVWYTYLGYERTKISVAQSLEHLISNEDTLRERKENIHVHVLLHWPRCDDGITWMNCEKEENDLPSYVKNSGDPVPHLHKDTAFLESWRALEDIYLGITHFGDDLPKVESIGVSNFYEDDLESLLKVSRVTPHILQGNVYSYVFDAPLISFCHRNGIHFQAYNIFNGIISRHNQNRCPRAFGYLQQIAHDVSEVHHQKYLTEEEYTPSQVLMKWLVQNDVSVIPRTMQLQHLQENSPYSIGKMPHLDTEEEEKIEIAVKALLMGEDLPQPFAIFATPSDIQTNFDIFWKNTDDNEEELVKENLAPGETFDTFTHQGHIFVAYDRENNSRREFAVTADFGQENTFRMGGEL